MITGTSIYFHDDLVTKAQGKDNLEPLIKVDQSQVSFWVKPFWDDDPPQVADPQMQELLDMEGQAFRDYRLNNPDFTVLLREAVVKKLEDAQSSLPENLKLVLKAGYRPIAVQKQLFQEGLEYFRKVHPEKSEKEIYEINLEFVADADNYTPPHSTGGAVDVLLFDVVAGKEVDMGSPINYPDNRSWTYYEEGLRQEQKRNRDYLTTVMLGFGFANLASEWWHYSYGDQYWAVFYDKEYIYGRYGND